jgi:hypothetical protein
MKRFRWESFFLYRNPALLFQTQPNKQPDKIAREVVCVDLGRSEYAMVKSKIKTKGGKK